ncbi:hypothetical protein KAR10_02835 [bacterium]|nr:hypothetical protein [bacterium]
MAVFYAGIDDDIDCGNITAINAATKVTMGIWFKAVGTGNQGLIMKTNAAGSSAGRQRIGMSLSANKIVYSVAQAQNSAKLGSITINDGNWHFACMVYDGTQGTPSNRIIP